MKKKDKLILYLTIGHLICFTLIYVISLIILFMCIKNIFMRVIGVLLLFLVCSWLEERVMVFIVNPIVWIFLPQDIRKEEIESAKEEIKQTIMRIRNKK